MAFDSVVGMDEAGNLPNEVRTRLAANIRNGATTEGDAVRDVATAAVGDIIPAISTLPDGYMLVSEGGEWVASPAPTGQQQVFLTQAEYNAIAPGAPNTLYVIVETPPWIWPFSDDFLTTEAPPTTLDTGQAWRVESGVWSTAAGDLVATADGALIVTNLGSNTQTVEYILGGNLVASGNPTIVLNYDNTNDWHYRLVKVNTSEFRLERRDTLNQLVFQTFPLGAAITAGARIRISVTGPVGAKAFRMWVNDVEVLEGQSTGLATTAPFIDTDSSPPNGTEAGFRMGYTASGGQYRFRSFRGAPEVVVP